MDVTAKNELMQKIDDYHEVIAGFADVLRQENAALQAFDVAAVSALFEQKNKMSLAYRSMVAFFIKHQEELAGRERLADIGLCCNGRGLIGLLLIVLLLGGRIQTCAAAGAEFCGIGIIGAAIRADHTKTPFEHYDFRLHYIIRNHERKEESA